MESFQKGDRVKLSEPMGILTTEDIGLVVEVYKDGILEIIGAEVAGTKDFIMPRGLFDYSVVFPKLRGWMSDYTNGPWLTDKVDLSQFHAGDAVPMAHDELVFVDSVLRDVA
jgi:hypothetical protein